MNLSLLVTIRVKMSVYSVFSFKTFILSFVGCTVCHKVKLLKEMDIILGLN